MGSRGRMVLRRVMWSLTLILCIAITFVAFQERQTIRDYFDAREFQPTSEVVQVLERIQLTPAGERIFLASRPQILQGEVFNDQCRKADSTGEGHLLGCFAEGSIHLFDVADDRLNSVVEVTAVHELMHAVYKRLPQRERESLGLRLAEFYTERIETDTELQERMEVYAHLSASQFANELHSVLATEVADLPDWLESHYSRWLQDRNVIITYFQAYRDVFASIEEEAEALKSRLDDMHAMIEADSSSYAAAVEAFNSDWQHFLARNEAYEFSSNPEEFDRLKAEFDSRRTQLDAWKLSIQDNIAEYEELRKRLEHLGELSLELNQRIDSTSPAPPG